MKILILSFYYTPDLSAGSFRTAALVTEIQKHLGSDDSIDIVTTMPNRYRNFKRDALQHETAGNTSIYRIELSNHKSGFIDQAISYLFYAYHAFFYLRKKKYDLIYTTSGRLFSGFLGAVIARSKNIPLYLDIRDIFVDTMKSLLSPVAKVIFIPVFSLVETFTFRSAKKINLVSAGFEDYFRRIVPDMDLSFFTNGIDDEFINASSATLAPPATKNKKIITYAGNIGKGQALELVIPGVSKLLGDHYEIRIIGDGGGRELLEQALVQAGSNNVVLIPPVDRQKLMEFYDESDFLFLHLNDVPAFEKVLPSKIFEYAATGKPILAGVQGYSRTFLKENIDNVMLFDPCDSQDFMDNFSVFKPGGAEREDFCNTYSRSSIMKKMAIDVLSINE